MAFDNQLAAKYDRWYQEPKGRYCDAMEKELFQRLVQPRRGESLLEVGCGTGHNLKFFRGLGLDITGTDISDAMLQIAAHQLGAEARLSRQPASHLSFGDNSFDIVVLITALEFMADPIAALKEAARVSRDRLYIGTLNKLSTLGINRRLKGKLKPSVYNQAQFYNIGEIKGMLSKALDNARFDWASALFIPLRWYQHWGRLDRSLSFHHNPLGAFLGICVVKPR
ncbi:MAG: class I SAM-dependent methyltransferase [Dehalococcoidales bacterium]|nr:class I SAM-dependent methyltransferase [Dehalococcoidales bacterium]